MVETMNRKKPKTLKQIADIWYAGYGDDRNLHYHPSRYCFLNLHSFFTGNHTVELRGFNSELHSGKIRSYVVLALALNHQALTQKCASARKSQQDNEKFALRTYLNRIGFIGDEFKNVHGFANGLGVVELQNGINGLKMTSKKNGNFIFLPAAGCSFASLLFGEVYYVNHHKPLYTHPYCSTLQ